MSFAIEMRGVTWSPGRAFTLGPLDLAVPEGAVYGFLGPNGAGKTTAIRIMLGMVRPDGGEVRVLGGRVPRDLPTILEGVGHVPERPHLYRQLTVGEALRYHAAFHPRWDRAWAEELVARLALDPARKIARMSKGETGKLLVALALAQRPRLLVLDEPTDGLDPVIRREVLTAILEYVSDTSATVLISSHLIHELERICDWVGVLDAGGLVDEMPMIDFKNGIKRVRVEEAPAELPEGLPFAVLERIEPNGATPFETWIVRGWDDDHRGGVESAGVRLRDVIDLDLEESFVALLHSNRASTTEV